MLIEIWKSVVGFEGHYEISNLGSVRSLKNNKPYTLKINRHKDGYCYVMLCKDKTRKNLKIHRLVAKAFIPNPENKPTVNHINHVRHCNFVWNLEWATYDEQIWDAIRFGSHENSIAPIWDKDKKDRLQQLVDSGMKRVDIAKQEGVSRDSLQKYFGKVKRPIAEVKRMHSEGFSYKEISIKLNIPKTTVARYVKS